MTPFRALSVPVNVLNRVSPPFGTGMGHLHSMICSTATGTILPGLKTCLPLSSDSFDFQSPQQFVELTFRLSFESQTSRCENLY